MNTPSVEYIKQHKYHRDFYLNRDFPGFLDIVNNQFPDISNPSERLWLYFNGYPTCPTCGGRVRTFINFNKGYTKYCCPTCAQKDPEVREKNEKTNTIRYGKDHVKRRVEKTAETKLKRYGKAGYNNPEAMRSTFIERYGVDNPLKSDVVKEKVNKTNMEKYGAARRITSSDYLKQKRDNIDNQLIKKYPEVMQVIDHHDGLPIFKCSCTDPKCSKCQERTFEIGYWMYYERKFVYKTEICPVKNTIYRNKNTNIELFVQNILDAHSVEYVTNNRNILSGTELDIYIPSRNLAIECNGIYWHRTAPDSRISKNYHHIKWDACKERGIQLLTIWEDQIVNKPEVVQNIILSRLGIYNERIGASKCEVHDVPAKEATEFLDNNHLQGSVNGSVRLGLYYKDRLASMMVFGRKRKALGSDNKGDTFELYRYCNACGVQVIHGAERLFKHFLKDHPGCIIESFSSNDISMGDLYRTLGFNLVGEQPTSYWYVDKNFQRHHRYAFRKDILVKNGADPKMTEFETTNNMGLYRIYDSGQQKWRHDTTSN